MSRRGPAPSCLTQDAQPAALHDVCLPYAKAVGIFRHASPASRQPRRQRADHSDTCTLVRLRAEYVKQDSASKTARPRPTLHPFHIHSANAARRGTAFASFGLLADPSSALPGLPSTHQLMPKLLVLFYSRTGNTAAIADAVAEGAKSVRFAEVDVRRIDDLASAAVIETAASEAPRSRR